MMGTIPAGMMTIPTEFQGAKSGNKTSPAKTSRAIGAQGLGLAHAFSLLSGLDCPPERAVCMSRTGNGPSRASHPCSSSRTFQLTACPPLLTDLQRTWGPAMLQPAYKTAMLHSTCWSSLARPFQKVLLMALLQVWVSHMSNRRSHAKDTACCQLPVKDVGIASRAAANGKPSLSQPEALHSGSLQTSRRHLMHVLSDV